jgi:asparagine synthase (glutamine-hydrolysing)
MEYLKETMQYCFFVSSDNFLALNGEPTISMDDGSVVIYLNGLVFCDKNELLRGFREKGPSFVEMLDGSFIIFLLIDKSFYILTDKLNSKRAFYTLVDQTWIISNNIDLLPINERPLSIKGISCYLAFGNMFNGITLFEGVETTQRSCIHSFQGNRTVIAPYWDLTFTGAGDYDRDTLEEELKGLLYESISKYSFTTDKPAISLSAGYDARCILGLFKDYLNVTDVACFSYGHNPPDGQVNDASVSKELAELCNYSYYYLKSFNGNLVELLTLNAKHGKCLANLCAELDGLNYIKKNIPLSDVFVGDQILDSVIPSDSFEIRLLDMLKHDHRSEMEWMSKYLDKEILRKLSETLGQTKADLLKRVENIGNRQDKQDYLYFDQRVCHVMMPWREYFTGIVGFVHNPLLYGPILEFVQKLPQELRFKKKLFLDLSKKNVP